jgi:CHAD domain-containing protein
VESIHRLRVLLRRLRVCLRLGSSLLGKEKVDAFRQWSSAMSDAVGGVRDVDMTLEWLTAQPESHTLRRQLAARRHRMWNAGRKKLVALQPVPRHVIAKRKSRGKAMQRLWRRFCRTLEAAHLEISAFNSPLNTADTEHWHELRRDLRRIRYLRELALPAKAQKKDELLRELVNLQELLGNAQNCVAALEVLPASGQGPEVRRLRAGLDNRRLDWLAKAQRALRAFQRSRAWKTLDPENL